MQLRMLLVCIHSDLKSFLNYKSLILDTYNPDPLCLREQGCEVPRLYFEAKRSPRANILGNTAPDYTRVSPDCGSKTAFRISVF